MYEREFQCQPNLYTRVVGVVGVVGVARQGYRKGCRYVVSPGGRAPWPLCELKGYSTLNDPLPIFVGDDVLVVSVYLVGEILAFWASEQPVILIDGQ
jgi:hypothetical protein